MGIYKDMAVRLRERERTCPFCEAGQLIYNGDYFDQRFACSNCWAEIMVVGLCEEEPIGDTKDGA